jgi:hypothetical protein
MDGAIERQTKDGIERDERWKDLNFGFSKSHI